MKKISYLLLFCFLFFSFNFSLARAEKTQPVIKLPAPDFKGMILEDAIKKRRSLRSYLAKPLSLKEISQLLYAAQGITNAEGGDFGLRAAPSAGATYPFEIYLFSNNITGLKKGIYQYLPESHGLSLIKAGDFAVPLYLACLSQPMLKSGGAVIAMAAVYARTANRYQARGLRYIDMEAGHISQNIYLQATSLGLGCVAIGAFSESELNRMLKLDGKESGVVYLNVVGKVK